MEKKTNKFLKNGVVLTAAATLLAACGSSASNSGQTSSESKYKELVVDTQVFSGDFFSGAFSNSSYDTQVINLTNATATVVQDGNGKLLINKGIVTNENLDRSTDADGNTVVTWHLRKDLKWSDGQAITAKDYVFNLLFTYSKEWTEAGAQVTVSDELVGALEYSRGEAKGIKGVKLVDDYTFSITIDKAHVPYFYELALFSVGAYPMHELAKDATITQGEDGAQITGADLKVVAEHVKTTQVDSKKPTVTYGKYNFDKVSDTEIVVTLNPNYVGNQEGVKPTIETIVLKANTNSELAIQRLQKGEVDFVPNLVDAALIKAATEDTNLGTIKYNRNGYGYLGMTNEFGPTADVNVRHAIGHLVNRNQLITDVLGGSGVLVNSQYSFAQWMAKDKEAELNSKLNKYEYSVEKANEALDKSAYRFEADGVTAFDSSKASADYLRYNANKEVLEIKHLGTDNNVVTTSLETNLLVDAPKAGIKYSVQKTDFATLQKEMNLATTKSGSEQYHIYNLASNFAGAVVDPYNQEHSRNLGTRANAWRVNDAEIDRISEEMRKIESSNTDAFANKWLEYQVRFNEILPILPLYSNTYYNAFASEKVDTDPTTSIRNWSQLIEYFRLK